ncbi:MAG: hypothetical protein ACKO2Z_02340, partial [Sphaerospermopsis kisseleviana]
NGKIHTNFETTVEQLRTDLTRILYHKIKQDKEALFDCWNVHGDDKQDYPEKPRLRNRNKN